MANTVGGDKVFTTPWTTDRRLELGNETLGSSTTYYAGQAIGRDSVGLMVQMDDTAKAEFLGILDDLVRTQVDSSDLAGDKIFKVEQPQMFTALIASAAAGDEGKRVYWLYNNQVQYTPGTYGNFAGTVWKVYDSTHVVVLPPWLSHATRGGRYGMIAGPATGTKTLTKWDVNTVYGCPITGSVSISLPVSTKCSPGDSIEFIKTSTGAFTISLVAQSTDSINLGASSVNYNSATTSFAKTVATTDANGNWYVS